MSLWTDLGPIEYGLSFSAEHSYFGEHRYVLRKTRLLNSDEPALRLKGQRAYLISIEPPLPLDIAFAGVVERDAFLKKFPDTPNQAVIIPRFGGANLAEHVLKPKETIMMFYCYPTLQGDWESGPYMIQAWADIFGLESTE